MLSKKEFSRVVALVQARDPRIDICAYMSSPDFTKHGGFALKGFDPVSVTIIELANLVSYQTLQFNGELDAEALDEIWRNRKAFNLVGEGSDEVEQRRSDTIDALKILTEA